MKKCMEYLGYVLLGSAILFGRTAGAQEVRLSSELAMSSTRAVPSAANFKSGAAGFSLKNICAYRVTMCGAGGSLTGGAFRAYYYSSRLDKVARVPAFDVTVSVTAACLSTGDITVPAYYVGGYVLFASDTLTFSAGTTANVYYEFQTCKDGR
jgi:hypothetical protein